jgi:hypothetical protein
VNNHLQEPKGCQLKNAEPPDGITPEVYERLHSKKKVQKDQTEADRWKDIYKLLFPNDVIPSPCKFYSPFHSLHHSTHISIFKA